MHVSLTALRMTAATTGARYFILLIKVHQLKLIVILLFFMFKMVFMHC